MENVCRIRKLFLYKLNIDELKNVECNVPTLIEEISMENISNVKEFRDTRVETNFKYMLSNGESGIYIKSNNQTIAHAWCIINNSNNTKVIGSFYKTNADVGYIHFCNVKADFRGNNVYPYIIHNLIKIINKKYNINTFYIDTDSNNVSSQNGINKTGFRLYKKYTFVCLLHHFFYKRFLR